MITEQTPRLAVVGAGPSGLVMARSARAAGIDVVVYERHTDVGGIWDPDNEGSPMYESAHFISSRYASGFYGYPMPDSFPDYPGYRLVRDYIRDFATEFDVYSSVRLGVGVANASLDGNRWSITDSTGFTEDFSHLVCANGVTWHPRLPHYPGLEKFTGELRHSSTFRHPEEFRGRRVLIVGGGNSGVDIACDAARNADAAYWSVRRGYRIVPKHLFGVPADVFAKEKDLPRGFTAPEDLNQLVDALVGDLSRFGLPKPDHDVLTSHPILNDAIVHHMTHGDIAGKPDVAEFRGDTAIFTDGSEERIDLVLFATGYDYRIPYVEDSLFDWKDGHPQLYLNMFSREVDNLYVLGFIEFADAAYKRLDEMAQLISFDIIATGIAKSEIHQLKLTHRPDLRGGIDYVDSARHSSYVESNTFQNTLSEIRDRFGLPALTDDLFAVATTVRRANK